MKPNLRTNLGRFLLGAVLFIITLILSITVEYISSKRKI